MRIHIATDHAGLEFSTQLQHHLAAQGHEVVDHGPLDYDPLDDYPAFCIRAAQAVVRDQQSGVEALGVVFGGSGNGEQMAANKVHGVRAALVWNLATAELKSRADEWAKEAGVPGRTLVYQKYGAGPTAYALLEAPGIKPWSAWTVPMSMREVEPGVNLVMEDDRSNQDPDWHPRPADNENAEDAQ